jgi:hypothetical protein
MMMMATTTLVMTVHRSRTQPTRMMKMLRLCEMPAVMKQFAVLLWRLREMMMTVQPAQPHHRIQAMASSTMLGEGMWSAARRM